MFRHLQPFISGSCAFVAMTHNKITNWTCCASLILQTPLHLAALTDQSDIVRRLILAGATADKRNKWGNTALHIACERGCLQVAKAILKPITPTEMNANVQSYRAPDSKSIQRQSNSIDLANYEGK